MPSAELFRALLERWVEIDAPGDIAANRLPARGGRVQPTRPCKRQEHYADGERKQPAADRPLHPPSADLRSRAEISGDGVLKIERGDGTADDGKKGNRPGVVDREPGE